MPAPFPPWSDGVLRLAVSLTALLAVAIPASLMAWVRGPYSTGQARVPQQPIAFDHRHHVADEGIDCLYCHYQASTGPTAGVPETAICMGCHRQVRRQAPEVSKIWASAQLERPISWLRVHDLPDFVFFDHGVHADAGVACQSCHGRVETMAAVIQVAPLTMKWCVDCHAAATAKTHCSTCHR